MIWPPATPQAIGGHVPAMQRVERQSERGGANVAVSADRTGGSGEDQTKTTTKTLPLYSLYFLSPYL
jgi:hypothetical protein